MTSGEADDIPELESEAADAVAHRGGHVQIIAAAGSGKTEVVSQRVAALLEEGEPAESIVAFTFTEKAAAELKERIRQRVTAKLGPAASDRLGRLYVGTIHGYCFRLLQEHVPKYETYTPLDSNQLTNLLYREQRRLQLKRLDSANKLFRAIKAFQESLDVVENELMEVDRLPDGDFKETVVAYHAMLDRYRFMSFGTQVVEAVRALENSEVRAKVTADLRHLIVDEYQDVNPAQERLIQFLAKPSGTADLVVVGDDDQAIYQWRGSNVENIVTFADRYYGVTQFNLLVNRRSRPEIVELANAFGQTIPERLEKEMGSFRDSAGPAVSTAIGLYDEETEASTIADDIERLHEKGVRYRDIAILVRGRTAYPRILDALEAYEIPVQPGGRTGLFEQREAALFGATFAWLSDIDWAPGRFIERETIELLGLLEDYRQTFGLNDDDIQALWAHLTAWQAKTKQDPPDWNPSLVGEFYDLTERLQISEWDLTDPLERNRMGTVARFTTVIADYEAVTRRSRQDPDNPSEQVGGAVGNEWFYRNFALLLVNYATGNYDDFDGEEDLLGGGGVALGTVHGAKGLEWPVVFLPSLTDGRFPSSRAGRQRDWLLPRNLFDAARYEGGDAEERRLFYVALTRARDWVALSSHASVTTNSARASPYIEEAEEFVSSSTLPTVIEPRGIESPDVAITYSELEAYFTCPRSYLLRNELGFMPPAKSELGYGNAVHHVMRVIAEHARATGALPTPRSINDLLTSDFFLPFANKAAHREMREKARLLIFKYVNEYKDDLTRTWATERPFELYLDGVVVSGRADVIYDEHDGIIDNLAIVDYKTATGGHVDPLQLQVYADAGRREGLTVAAAFVNDMGTTTRHVVEVGDDAIAGAERTVVVAAQALKERDFTPRPEATKCASCDVRPVCGAAARK
jgi:DNA helicase-2/ATP-dependent DNA helicase PcrA